MSSVSGVCFLLSPLLSAAPLFGIGWCAPVPVFSSPYHPPCIPTVASHQPGALPSCESQWAAQGISHTHTRCVFITLT